MIVFQCDVNGFYVGPISADESPLEPGVFLVPGGCVLQEPPAPKKGHLLRHVDGSWVYEKLPVPVPLDPAEVDSVPPLERLAAFIRGNPEIMAALNDV